MAPIEIWRPNQQLRWIERTSSGQPAAVEFNLESRGGKTIVRLVQCGFDGDSDWDNEWYDSCNYGWEFMLVNLRHYLERHAAQPRLVA